MSRGTRDKTAMKFHNSRRAAAMLARNSHAHGDPASDDAAFYLQTRNWSRRCRHILRSPSSSSTDEDSACDTPIPEEFTFMDSSHPTALLGGLSSLREDETFSDVTLCFDDVEVKAHKVVLAAFSEYFKAMFACQMKESSQNRIQISSVDARTGSALVNFAYTSSLHITKTNVQSLLSTANLWQVDAVKEACSSFMLRHLDASNAVGVHVFAEAHNCDDLRKRSRHFILEHFEDVWKHEEFLQLTKDKLIDILKDDSLNSDREENVFLAAEKWVGFDFELRKKDFHEVLKEVRLELISPYFIVDHVEKSAGVKDGGGECKDLVERAKLSHLLPGRRNELKVRLRCNSDHMQVILAVGGEDDKVVLRSVECFLPETRAWKTLACLPYAISKHGVVVAGRTEVYLAGGEYPDGSASRSVWKYDTRFDCWFELAQMNEARSELGLAMVDDAIYAVGGWEGSQRLKTVEKYDIEKNEWAFVSPLRMAVTSPAVVGVGGRLYVTGGAILEDGDGIEAVQVYDKMKDEWSEVAPMLIPRSGSAACVFDGFIYVLGGWHASTENTNKVERYNIKENKWEFRESMLERRYRPGVAVVDSLIYVMGGEEGWDRYHDTVECYDPSTDTWRIVGSLQSCRSWLSCCPVYVKKSALLDK